MANAEGRTIHIPAEQAAFVDAKVAAGEYASASDVVTAGLQSLQDHDQAIERWLRTEVVEAYDEMKKDPTRGIPIEKVFDEIRALHRERMSQKG